MNDDLLNMVPVESPNTGQPSPAQARLMESLLRQLAELDTAVAGQAHEYMVKMAGHWTPGREGNASRWIDRMIAKVRNLRDNQPVVGDGMYVLDGQVYKVQHAVHGSGNLYAKRLQDNGPGKPATFEYSPGTIRRIRPEHRMTKEQAKEWGALYGTCARCGALLTAEDSIDRMMGPVCSTKI